MTAKPVENPQKIPFILASSSPRRSYLMRQVHFDVEILQPQVDEKPLPHERPKALVFRLAQEKAESVRAIAIERYEKSIVLAADTVVAAPGEMRILGKPETAEEAQKMLKMLSGKKHTVFTGYCLILSGRNTKIKRLARVVQSRVKMRQLTQKEIMRYVASGEPMDKAGAYGAQGLGMALIERIEGSYTNVVGLPMAQILLDLEKGFKIPLFSWVNSE